MFNLFKRTDKKTEIELEVEAEFKAIVSSININNRKQTSAKIEELRSSLFTGFMRYQVKRDTEIYLALQQAIKSIKSLTTSYQSLNRESELNKDYYDEAIDKLYKENIPKVLIVSYLTNFDLLFKAASQQSRVVEYLNLFSEEVINISNGEKPSEKRRDVKRESAIDISTGTTSYQRDRINQEHIATLISALNNSGTAEVEKLVISGINNDTFTFAGTITPITGVYYTIHDNATGKDTGFNASSVIEIIPKK